MTKRTVFMLLLSIGLILGLSSAAYASDWTSFQKNNYNNGVVDGVAPSTSSFTPVWNHTISGSGWVGWDGAPIIANGTVYDIYFNGYVYAYDLTTGTNVWTNSAVGGGSGSFELSTAAYDTVNDRLFVALSNGNSSTSTSVHAINGITGATVWSNTSLSNFPANHQFNSGIKYDDGKVYVANCVVSGSTTTTGNLTCLDASTGVVEWNYHNSAAGFYWATPAIIGDYVVIGCDDGYVRSFNKATGALVEGVNAGDGSIRGGITYDGSGYIYFTTTGGSVFKYSFNSATGDIGNTATAYDDHGTRMTTTPTVAGNFVYVTDDSAVIHCYYKSTMSQRSSIDLTSTWGGIKASPVVYDAADGYDYVYVTVNAPTAPASCVYFDSNGRNPDVAGTFGPAGYTLQGVAIVDGYIVFGNDVKYIGCFN
ncbi:outer membrane protein assembly factor BamB family protein [Methanolobus psychrotolerans]|uniref:outer membrane protein assembly factor BamB family protein n=1 Tax=Methanolobus psychrotolerans TaxID=1874706 RepID=UPI000B918412|nr:PQQ-binding-like beta-propeller repeat protein [Methanolobus psychrotolerans]